MREDGDDEGLLDKLGERIEDVLYVETLMGWDGDPCACQVCDCPRFHYGGNIPTCPECAAGRHFGQRAGEE